MSDIDNLQGVNITNQQIKPKEIKQTGISTEK